MHLQAIQIVIGGTLLPLKAVAPAQLWIEHGERGAAHGGPPSQQLKQRRCREAGRAMTLHHGTAACQALLTPALAAVLPTRKCHLAICAAGVGAASSGCEAAAEPALRLPPAAAETAAARQHARRVDCMGCRALRLLLLRRLRRRQRQRLRLRLHLRLPPPLPVLPGPPLLIPQLRRRQIDVAPAGGHPIAQAACLQWQWRGEQLQACAHPSTTHSLESGPPSSASSAESPAGGNEKRSTALVA